MPVCLRVSRIAAAVLFCLLSSSLIPYVSAQATVDPRAERRKEATAMHVPTGTIKVDGFMDEEIWQKVTPVTDFAQQEPTENAPPSEPMEVRFVYDDTALYVGARMFGTPETVQAPLGRRDDVEQAEYLQIELDTFLDRRTAYMFGVTASGVRQDHFHPTDNETDVDEQFDPVWASKTHIDDRGWTAEFWIPLSQLRFNNATSRTWGLNIRRYRPQLNEQDYWVVIGRTNRGWSSRFGNLRGLDDLRPKQRLEVLPYVSSNSRLTGHPDPADPFDKGANLGGRMGADMKIGLGPNLTLEATVNPDFGQVEADPSEVNLTVFETIFDERRPFFIEGNSVIEAATGNFYYSRRIGARPTVTATNKYVNYPTAANIIGAAKLTGRSRKGLSVGFLSAVTNEAVAKTSDGLVRTDVPVAPVAEWSVARAIQEFGRERNTIGAHVTWVHREMDASDPLAALLTRNAVTYGVDTRIRFADRTYEIAANVGMTHVDGEPAAISRVQQANGHLWQRLDQPNIRFDPTRRGFLGNQSQASINKIAGRHWLWGYNLMVESPGFETLDFGRLNYAGDVTGGPRLTYRETRPGKYLRAYSTQIGLNNYWYFDTDLGLRNTINSNNSVTFRNFWQATLNINRYFRGQDAQLTRGGPAMATPRGLNFTYTLRNATGANTRWTGGGYYRRNELGDVSWNVNGSLSARPRPELQVSIAPNYINERGTNATLNGPINRQYLTTIRGNGNPQTYNNRYIFGLVDRTTLSTQFRLNYTFKPDLTLDVYMEPFAASGQFSQIGELAASRQRDLRLYGTDGTTITRLTDLSYRITDGTTSFSLANRDFNQRNFRSNVVLRWEWRPGSIFYFVWQQNRAETLPTGEHVAGGDLVDAFTARGANILAVKSTFWFSRR